MSSRTSSTEPKGIGASVTHGWAGVVGYQQPLPRLRVY